MTDTDDTPDDPRRLLSPEQAGHYLNLSADTMRLLARTGQLYHIRVGRRYRFLQADLDAWIDTERRLDQPPPPEPVATGKPQRGRPQAGTAAGPVRGSLTGIGKAWGQRLKRAER